MPGNARARADGAKLVNDVSRNEVEIVVFETESSISNTITTHLV